MNIDRHANAFRDLFKCRIQGDAEKADQIRAFYEEYFAIMDLDADFFLQTIETIFQKNALAEGKLLFKGRPVVPRAIKRTFLLTVEGEKDDICAVGQTLAAQDLCGGLRPYMKSHHLQPDVGHYGVFNGRRWDNQIYPILRDHIQCSAFLKRIALHFQEGARQGRLPHECANHGLIPGKLCSRQKTRGARVHKNYSAPATPHQRLIADSRALDAMRARVNEIYSSLDPVALLRERLARLTDAPPAGDPTSPPPIDQFLASLRTAWKEGAGRPTDRPIIKKKRERRRPDPLLEATPQLRQWFEAEPWRTSSELLSKLQAEYPGTYPTNLLRSLQDRAPWRGVA
jgi:PHB de-polymerase C-terminus